MVLAITGVEALYADMGHLARPDPARLVYGGVASLVLNYFGQGRCCWPILRPSPTPFFLLAPKWALLPLLLLATLATVIASQAVISGSSR